MSYLFTFFFFNDTATTEIYTLSLHDALPISLAEILTTRGVGVILESQKKAEKEQKAGPDIIKKIEADRKSTRLNSSHSQISYAVFCLKKKKIDTYAERQKHIRT